MKVNQNLIRIWLLCAVMLPAAVQAQFLFITNADNTITITGYTGSGGVVTIPSMINGLTNTSIGVNAFYQCFSLTSVTIPNGVTSLGVEAFSTCTNLTSVTIPNTVTNIGAGAFAFCYNLTNITIPSSVTYIDMAAFYFCTNLMEVHFQGNAPGGGSDSSYGTLEVFFGDDNAIAFFLPGTKGWNSYFGGLPTWSSYYTTNNGTITIIGYAGIGGAVTIPTTVYGLRVASIGTNAFAYNSSVTSATIPNSVTNIGDEAFYFCTNLTTLYVQGNAPNIGSSVFYGVTNAIVYYLPGATGWGATFAGLTSWALYPFNCTTNNGTITITGYTGIGGAVTIPSSITGLPVIGIGDYAFEYSYTLTGVTIPNSVTSIGQWAFYDCNNLTSVTIPDSVTNLESLAFQGCTTLTNLTLPNHITSISDELVAFCPSLTQITIPNSITRIGDYAFSHSGLTSITIPKSVTSVGSDVFESCTNLVGAYFQGNAPSVGSLVFFGENTPTIYYLPGTTGWGPTFGGRPTALWNPQVQKDGSFGMRTNHFGFNIIGSTNLVVVVEACTNFANPVWQPVQTNTLTGGSSYFSDSQWINYPGRFYRLRSP